MMVGGTGAGAITMLKACVAFGDTPLLAVTTPAYVPAVVGGPLRAPLLLMASLRIHCNQAGKVRTNVDLPNAAEQNLAVA